MKLKSKEKKKVFRIGITAGMKRKQPRKTMKQSVPFVQTSEHRDILGKCSRQVSGALVRPSRSVYGVMVK